MGTSLQKQHVLLVDDEPQVLVALEDLLADRFVVTTADSAERALRVMEDASDIAVVVTDQRMPKMSGDELVTRLSHAHDARRILVTGYADLSSVVRAVNDGQIFAYVTKPWNPEDLRSKVTQAAEEFRRAQELASERKLLHDLLTNMPDGIYFKDRDLRFLKANHAFASEMRAAVDTLVGRRLVDFDHLEEANEVEAMERSVIESGRPRVDAVRESSWSGTKRWISETTAPILSREGETIGLVGITRDVSERRRTEQALRLSEERFRQQSRVLNSVLDSMAEGVVVADPSGKFLLFNPEARRILGAEDGADAPHEWASVPGLFEADQKTPLDPTQRSLLSLEGGAEETEVFVKNDHVSGTVVALTSTPVRDDENELIGSIALLRDVTEKRQLERQLLQSQKMEAVGQLAGGVAHDFNNLLAVIQSYGELILEDLPDDDARREDVGELLKATNRAAALTKQLLTFSRRQPMRTTTFELNQVVVDVEKMLHRLIGESVELETRLGSGLGLIRADVNQIEQVIVNLTINARDAMPGGGRLVLETSVATLPGREKGTTEKFVRLSVRDTGTGMTPEVKKRIFEPFYTTKEVGRGTGLGLSTVYGIVQQSGGRIDVESELGRGTTFEIFLPVFSEESDKAELGRSGPVAGHGNETILLVEDEEAVRRVAARVLRERGYTVLEASTPVEARRLMKENGDRIQLLLTDMVMPETSGPQLAEEFVRARPRLRVLYMSGYVGRSMSEQSWSELGLAYLEKPFTPSALAERVRAVLSLPDVVTL